MFSWFCTDDGPKCDKVSKKKSKKKKERKKEKKKPAFSNICWFYTEKHTLLGVKITIMGKKNILVKKLHKLLTVE